MLKLFFLGVRQISKPIANRAKDAAHSSGLMKAVAVGIGRGMYRLQTQVTRLSEGKPPLLRVAQLEEEEALVRTARSRHPAGPGHLLVVCGGSHRPTPRSRARARQVKGAETLSEMIIYSVAGATVAYEYNLCGRPRPTRHLTPRHLTPRLFTPRAALSLSHPLHSLSLTRSPPLAARLRTRRRRRSRSEMSSWRAERPTG